MSIENEIYGMRADIGALSATVVHLSGAVTTLSNAVRQLEEAGIQVKLDLAQYRGTMAGAMIVITTLAAIGAWVWEQFTS